MFTQPQPPAQESTLDALFALELIDESTLAAQQQQEEEEQKETHGKRKRVSNLCPEETKGVAVEQNAEEDQPTLSSFNVAELMNMPESQHQDTFISSRIDELIDTHATNQWANYLQIPPLLTSPTTKAAQVQQWKVQRQAVLLQLGLYATGSGMPRILEDTLKFRKVISFLKIVMLFYAILCHLFISPVGVDILHFIWVRFNCTPD